MGYSLIILAVLARIRVLVQQVLLDAVSVFNLVSDLSLEKHSLKLKQDGVEVFREYYPPCKDVITLECVWEGDKFVLHEKRHKSAIKNQDEAVLEAPTLPSIQYETVDISNEGVEQPSFEHLDNEEQPVTEGTSNDVDDQHFRDTHSMTIDQKKEEFSNAEISPSKSVPSNIGVENVGSSESAVQFKVQSNSSKRVAFIQVKTATSSETDLKRFNKKAKIDHFMKEETSEINGNEDPFFRLLTGGCLKDKLF